MIVEPECGYLLLNVFRDIDPDRPGAAAARQAERLDQSRRDLPGMEHQAAVLHDRARHADDVGLLKRILSDQAAFDLPGDDHHRNGVHTGIGDAGQQIRRSGTARRHADADTARSARIAVRGESAALFVARQDHPDR